MKILFLTQFFWPEVRTAPTNLASMAQDLQEKGHDVLVITGFPNHPFGKVYDGYKMKLWEWDNLGDVKILRVPLFPDHSVSKSRRALNYASFTLSSTVLGLPFSYNFKPDIIFTYFAPLTISFASTVLSRFHGKVPVVYWITDIWPENLRATGVNMSERMFGYVRQFEDWGYRQATAICVDSPGFATNLIQKGVPEEKIEVVVEWADEDLFYPVEPDEALARAHGLEGKFNVIYGGNLGTVQCLQTVVDAAKLVEDAHDIQFVFIGDGNDMANLKKRVVDLNLQNVRFIPRQPLNEIHRFFALANVLLVHLKREPIFQLQLPSKIIAYMACGRPLLCGVPGASAQIVQDAEAGLVCPSEDAEAMAKQVLALYAMPVAEREAMGKRGRDAYLTSYTRKVQVQRIEKVLQGVCSSM